MVNTQQIHSLKNNYDEQQSLLQAEPLDPAVERVRKRLMRLMLLSIVITIVLILSVLVAIVYKITTHEEVASKPEKFLSFQKNSSRIANHTLTLPKKTQILSQSLSDQNIVLEVLTPEGQTKFMIYNYRSGALIATLSIEMVDEISAPSLQEL